MNKKIVVITGPTGVGKTKLSTSLAKRINGEIINGDAIQVYRGLDIGSAKVTKEEMQGVRHHLFDIKEVTEEYSIYDYQKDCREVLEDIFNRGKVPIIVGGTGLYIKGAIFNYTFKENKELDNQYEELKTEELYNKLKEIDDSIEIDRYNRRRIIRALNYYLENNESIRANKDGNTLLYDTIFIGLTTDREILYDKINRRVDKMLEDGLLEEVELFYRKGIRTKPLLSGIGYKELYHYLDGDISYEEAIRLIKRNSRRYAKRQYTFFNNQFKMKWFMTDYDCFDKTVNEVYEYVEDKM